MTTNSGGLDWITYIHSIFPTKSSIQGLSDLLNLSQIIKISRDYLFEKPNNYREFYDSFVILAADFIAQNIDSVSKKDLWTINDASSILLEYLMQSFETAANSSVYLKPLAAIRSLCLGIPSLSVSEQLTIISQLKASTYPIIRSSSNKDNLTKTDSTKHNRLELYYDKFEPLLLQIRDGNVKRNISESVNSMKLKTNSPNSSKMPKQNETDVSNLKVKFFEKNIETLMNMKADKILIELCLQLPFVRTYLEKSDQLLVNFSAFGVPLSVNEATVVRNSLSATAIDINLIVDVISLPIFEPLKNLKLSNFYNLSMACLHMILSHVIASNILAMNISSNVRTTTVLTSTTTTATTTPILSTTNTIETISSTPVTSFSSAASTTTNTNINSQSVTKDDEDETQIIHMIDNCFQIFDSIGKTIKNSPRAGGYIYQNYLLCGAWILINGPCACLMNTPSLPSGSRELKNTRNNYNKLQQGFNVYSVSLSLQMVKFLSELLKDLNNDLDENSEDLSNDLKMINEFSIMENYSPLRRIYHFFQSVPVQNLLFTLAMISYRKACSFRQTPVNNTEAETHSDSSTCYEEEGASFSDITEATATSDDDGESLFGRLFDETPVPNENEDQTKSSSNMKTETEQDKAMTCSLVPEKSEPHGFIKMATEIFELLDKQLLCSKNRYIKDYLKLNLSDQEMIILTTILKDLDKELSRSDSSTWTVNVSLIDSFMIFSEKLSKFVHNFIAHPDFNDLIPNFLMSLGISPFNSSSQTTWPLQIHPRILSALIQIVLTKSAPERENSILNMWQRVIYTLKTNITNPSAIFDFDNEDINVEHLETLLFFFYSLNLMQKKAILLTVEEAIIQISQHQSHCFSGNFQIIQVSRLLLIFDFLMKHLYEIPSHLLDRIQYNINSINDTKVYVRKEIEWGQIEENYRNSNGFSNTESLIKPRFYVITKMDNSLQDIPRLDGLACNFILNSDKTSYVLLFDSLISLLNVVNQFKTNKDLTILGECAIEYCFNICWNILLMMPPSFCFLEELAEENYYPTGGYLLYLLIWGPRISNGSYNRWLKDHIVKQGMYATQVAKLMKRLNERIENYNFKLKITKECILSLMPKSAEPPVLLNCILLDTIISRLYLAWEMEENVFSKTINIDLHNEIILLINRLIDTTVECTRQNLLLNLIAQQTSIKDSRYFSQAYEVLESVMFFPVNNNKFTASFGYFMTNVSPIYTNTIIQEWHSEINDKDVIAICSRMSLSLSSSCSSTSITSTATPSLATIASSICGTPPTSNMFESRLLTVINFHTAVSKNHSLIPSMKHLLHSLLRILILYVDKTTVSQAQRDFIISLVTSMSLDLRFGFLYDLIKTMKEKINLTDAEYDNLIYSIILDKFYRIMTNYIASFHEIIVFEKILEYIVDFMTLLLTKPNGLIAFEQFCKENKHWPKVFVYMSVNQSNHRYNVQLVILFNKIFTEIEKQPNSELANNIIQSLTSLASTNVAKIQSWLFFLILRYKHSKNNLWDVPITTNLIDEFMNDIDNNESFIVFDEGKFMNDDCLPTVSNDDDIEECYESLKRFVINCLKQKSNEFHDILSNILTAILPISSQILLTDQIGCRFRLILQIIMILSHVCDNEKIIDTICQEWLPISHKYLLKPIEENNSNFDNVQLKSLFDPTTKYLSFFTSILKSISLVKYSNDVNNENHVADDGNEQFRELYQSVRSISPLERCISNDFDYDFFDEMIGDEDSVHDDSDDDSLCNKLCTYTLTQKEYVNQHWYHCHTCHMVSSIGVCSICARVCHKGHDLSYSKYGTFFCDCGDKGEGSCQALVKRISQSINNQNQDNLSKSASGSTSSYSVENQINPKFETSKDIMEVKLLLNSIDVNKKFLEKRKINFKNKKSFQMMMINVLEKILDILKKLQDTYERKFLQYSSIGSMKRALNAIQETQILPKHVVHNESLMFLMVDSQEGAFEPVRMNFSNEQGQSIKQLLTTHIIQRVGMCCLNSVFGKKQHLVLAHEKGKLFVLQLSTLLKQVDMVKQKLTLTHISSVPISFTVISMAENVCNEDNLAVCGFRDCHVLTFNNTGNVVDHIILHPQLEQGNFIVKAMWLPGSQTQLALLTADFIKIYDLSVDITAPTYYFLLPSGKVRDCTFIFYEAVKSYYILIMSSPGLIYFEMLNELSSAKHGSFYVTNTIDILEMFNEDSNVILITGISIYYSHCFGLLFCSFAGKNYVAHINVEKMSIKNIMELDVEKNGRNLNPTIKQSLFQWKETPNHPGLITCVTYGTNNPVVIMIDPKQIFIEEIKLSSFKTRISDLITVRHTVGYEQRTSMILLCEDGSLRIYMAKPEVTNYWLPYLTTSLVTSSFTKSSKKKKLTKNRNDDGTIIFPVDFFEHCQMIDVEFGGNDLLQVYNAFQIKSRLANNSLYVASTKATGFSVEVTNNDNNMIIAGVRVLIGSQGFRKAPTFIKVFDRTIETRITYSRWFDIPLTENESLLADKELIIHFGPSQDHDHVNMVDNIIVYGKLKESVYWSDDTDESNAVHGQLSLIDSTSVSITSKPQCSSTTPSVYEDFIKKCLEVLDWTFSLKETLNNNDYVLENENSIENDIKKITLQLLTKPAPNSVHIRAKALLATIFIDRQKYHSCKDVALLDYIFIEVYKMRELIYQNNCYEIDVDNFYRLLLITCNIAVKRPKNLAAFINSKTKLETHIFENPLQIRNNYILSADQHSIIQLMEVFFSLFLIRPRKPELWPVFLPGLRNSENVVFAFIEIIHSFMLHELPKSSNCNTTLIDLYFIFLTSKDQSIAFTARKAIAKVLKTKERKKRITVSSLPMEKLGIIFEESKSEQQQQQQQTIDTNESRLGDRSLRFAVDQTVALRNESQNQESDVYQDQDADQENEQVNIIPLEVLLNEVDPFNPSYLDIEGLNENDDDAMVEYAIAISLEEQELHILQDQEPAEPDNSNNAPESEVVYRCVPMHSGRSNTVENSSDSTASGTGSDDEGSTAATDGSTLRTSPAENVEINENPEVVTLVDYDSGESNADSIVSASTNITVADESVPDTSIVAGPSTSRPSTTIAISTTASSSSVLTSKVKFDIDSNESDSERNQNIHTLQLQLLEKMIKFIPNLKEFDGIRVIPFTQVLLLLVYELDMKSSHDGKLLESLVYTILNELEIKNADFESVDERTDIGEVQLILMKFLGILASRLKKATVSNINVFVATRVAKILQENNMIEFCLQILKSLIPYWKRVSSEDKIVDPNYVLLKNKQNSSLQDMQPIFSKAFVSVFSHDVFETYQELWTEVAVTLPYLIHRYSGTSLSAYKVFNDWADILCEYMIFDTPFAKKQIRKLLMHFCGNKDRYRQLRDHHLINNNMDMIVKCCKKGLYNENEERHLQIVLPYDSQVKLVEYLKTLLDVATNRIENWQKYCVRANPTLPFLLKISYLLDESVAFTVLLLLQSAFYTKEALILANSIASNSSSTTSSSEPSQKKSQKSSSTSTSSSQPKQIDEKSRKKIEPLADLLFRNVSTKELKAFLKRFLLDTNTSAIRWQTHALIESIYSFAKSSDKDDLFAVLWSLWPSVTSYGQKAIQFVDLLGYMAVNHSRKETGSLYIKLFIRNVIEVLKEQNNIIIFHPNANLYTNLSYLTDLSGYYLESEPCLVCNNPEVSYSLIKLSSIRVDSKYTTTSQIVKLNGSHTISRIALKITDLKRSKMIRVMNIYYNNRRVHAIIELKNKPSLWNKAKRVTLHTGQTDVKIDFVLPIIACNLMIEYADFYENVQATSDNLQCPRCSASVPSNPGVCSNCGENVFQCHKCRAINYDEKDPFLCHACGFCKYAKFDFSLTAKPCCAVETIENDDDRKKTEAVINSLMEKADRVYGQLIAIKPALDNLLISLNTKLTYDNFLLPSQSSSVQFVMVNNAQTSATTTSTNTLSTATTNNNSNITPNYVSKSIQMITQKYCLECKPLFEELSKISQRILACRQEISFYDKRNGLRLSSSQSTSSITSISGTNIVSNINDIGPEIKKSLSKSCYGCSIATTQHCLAILNGLLTCPFNLQISVDCDLIDELVKSNLKRIKFQSKDFVICLLLKLCSNNEKTTKHLFELLMEHVTLALKAYEISPYLSFDVRSEMLLLTNLSAEYDSCWELKLRYVVQLFLNTCPMLKYPMIMTSITLPCLKIIHNTIKQKQKVVTDVAALLFNNTFINVDKWLDNDPRYSYEYWQLKLTERKNKSLNLFDVHSYYLMEKYFFKWYRKVFKIETINYKAEKMNWLKNILFNSSSRNARQTVCNIIESFAKTTFIKMKILDLLTSYLPELRNCGENSQEFLALFMTLIRDSEYRKYLAVRGILKLLADLLTKEINHLHVLEKSVFSSDLSQGFALQQITNLLAKFMENYEIRRNYKKNLVEDVLNGYLSLKRLVLQRTRIIDMTQEKLLELLNEITTGTQEEIKNFMAICIKTVDECSPQDMLTPVFVFERLCSLIYPEETDLREFFLTLEKDPQQEDFLQGRMVGNPYSRNDPDLGPLMRDIKNKICRDCELIALLEDDNSMELLVHNKIISLSLPVKEVFKKVWLTEGGDPETMRVVYRMRGLLGDATEEFIETLESNRQKQDDPESIYILANVVDEFHGLEVMMNRLEQIDNVQRGRTLLQVLLKLFNLCIKVNRNRKSLCDPKKRTVAIFLKILQMFLRNDITGTSNTITNTTTGTATDPAQCLAIAAEILVILDTILSTATQMSIEEFTELTKTFGDADSITCLWSYLTINKGSLMAQFLRVLAALVYCNVEKMSILMKYFKPIIDFEKFDRNHTEEDEELMNMFCVLTSGIKKNQIGHSFKDYIASLNVIHYAIDYIQVYSPSNEVTHLDSEEFETFINRPALKYILKILAGLADGYDKIQKELATNIIPILHKLEQISSEVNVGILAENLLEALRQNAEVAKKIEEVRERTKSQKKKLAMAMREKQLGALGMKTNDKGQVTAKCLIMQQLDDLSDETGLVCCICREGYKYQSSKVLGVYTFSKKCNLEPFEIKTRKTIGYTTVTHFNVIHVDCHMNAIRLHRVRDEWHSATLQNSNTKCNGILPFWGPGVPESVFAFCLARHNNYLQEATAYKDIGYISTVHDLKLLLLRFANERSFHDDCGGGGPQSNIHLIPYMMHMALYVINTTQAAAFEEKILNSYLNLTSTDKWVESSHDVAGPLYYITMSLMLHSRKFWLTNRLVHLKRLLILAHVRHVSTAFQKKTISDRDVKPYNVYKPYLVFYGLVDGIYKHLFKNVVSNGDKWSVALADFIRNSDEFLMKATDKLLEFYTEELLPCTSFEEFCDVCDLLDEISNPSSYISSLLLGM